jgi:hypothetical protein
MSNRHRHNFSPTTAFFPTTIMSTSLDQLKETGTVVVSDSGDFECEHAFSVLISPAYLCIHSYRCLQASGLSTLIYSLFVNQY